MKKIGTILLMIFLLAGCDKGGADKEKGQLGLGIDNIAGEWTTSDSSKNPWGAEKLSISETGSQASNTIEASTTEAGELDEYENVGVPAVASAGKAGSESEGENCAYNPNPICCLSHPLSPFCKKKKPGSSGTSSSGTSTSSSGSTEVMSATQSLLSLYVTTVKPDGSTGPLSNTSAAGEESSSLIKLKLATTPEREDYYLIRKVSGTTYLDICECESGECTDANYDQCYTYFKNLVDSNTPGAFKKDL